LEYSIAPKRLSGPEGVKVLRLLVDTGSVFTILPVEVLESVGCSPAASEEHVRIITGSGYLIAPKVGVAWFQSLGQKVDRMAVVAHTLPIGSVVDGLLGMDFLAPLGAPLLIGEAAVVVS
jgi:predicted aspartyl protease